MLLIVGCYQLYQTKQPPPVPAGIELSGLADDLRLKCFAA